MDKKILDQIDLMGSSSCDLKCSYCYITKNCSFFNYDKFIKEAWETGEYLKTIEKVFEKMDQSPLTIKTLQLWGGEPTLHMQSIAKNGAALGKMFPNITQFLIPTNWFQTDFKALGDFITDLSANLTPRERCEDHLNFHIRAFIDGPPGDFNKFGHHVSWEKYKQNFDNFCDYIETKGQIKNTTIVFAVCPTTTQALILKNLKTYDQIFEFKEYIKNVSEYVTNRLKKIKNVSIHLSSPTFTPRIALSQTTTVEEAVEMERIVRLLEYYHYENKQFITDGNNEIQNFHDNKGESYFINRNHECPESNETALTLMPDGTIAECPCTFLQNLDSYKKELLDHKDFWEYKSSLIRMPNFYNPLHEDIHEDEYHSWYVFNGGYLGTNSTYANLNLSLAYEMALSGQIDPVYVTDPELLIKHYFSNFMTAECYREHVNVTHNHFLTDHNMFRRWYNGYTEYAYNDHKSKIKQRFKDYLKEEYNELESNDLSNSR